MQVGVVKWYDCRMGYGFIIAPTGEDVLAHYSVIEGKGFRRLWDGEEVEFDAVMRPKGLNATFVRRLHPERHPPKTADEAPPETPAPPAPPVPPANPAPPAP